MCKHLICRRLKLFDTFGKQFYSDRATKNVIATVCGWNSPPGQVVGLLLKLSNLIQEIRLHDATDTNGTALDLKHISSKCRIRSYNGPTQLRYALRVCCFMYLFNTVCISISHKLYCLKMGVDNEPVLTWHRL